MTPDDAILALRTDLALQIARHVRRSGETQVRMSALLGVPQPTLSRIANGDVSRLSLELLLRIAVRAGLPVVLQTGTEPAEAGVYAPGEPVAARVTRSTLGDAARRAVAHAVATPEQRLEAQLRHSELLVELNRAARGARRPARAASRPGAR